jgi:hypothetical protein
VSAPVEDRSHWELFYSYPSVSAPALFGAAAALIGAALEPASATEAFENLHEVAKTLQVSGSPLSHHFHILTSASVAS